MKYGGTRVPETGLLFRIIKIFRQAFYKELESIFLFRKNGGSYSCPLTMML